MIKLEKNELEICFIPILCSAPLIYAHSHGFFAKNNLTVNLKPAPGWSGIKELIAYGKADAVHMLAPMPLACSLGIDGKKADIKLAAVQNVNGQALTLANKHQGITNCLDMRGFTFGVPYRFSMHYYLLCYFLAENGVNPLKDVTIIEVAPPQMPYYMEQGQLDGYFAPEPFNQIAVHRNLGFIYILSKDIWPGHPCCGFATSREFMEKYPNTYQAMLKSVLQAELSLHYAKVDEKIAVAHEISESPYLNQADPTPVVQTLTGEYPDGKGNFYTVPDRIDFIPHPWEEYGGWMVSQMQRWGQLAQRVDYREVLESVFDSSHTRELAETLGFKSEMNAQLAGIAPFTGQNPFFYMQHQPFSAFQEQLQTMPDYNLSERIRSRLNRILQRMADVAGGDVNVKFEVTSNDEIGLLEQMLNEIILNTKFTRESLAEKNTHLKQQAEMLAEEVEERKQAEIEQKRLQQEVIEAQQHAIQELSVPIIPVMDRIIVIPLIGSIDSMRASDIMRTLLAGITEHRAKVVILDITGVAIVDTGVAAYLDKIIQAARLKGARTIVTGISDAVAETIIDLGIDWSNIETVRDLQTGLMVALQSLGMKLRG
ncbi:ABC transporter substrate-binding protein [Anaerolineales bacterium HSG24]|nr:ABC transporter substrate-binding protein [Anaerolineales bacterium HSG24]